MNDDTDLNGPLPAFSTATATAQPETAETEPQPKRIGRPPGKVPLPPSLPIQKRTYKSLEQQAREKQERDRQAVVDGQIFAEPKNAHAGAPYVITPEMEKEILGYIGVGNYTEVAVLAAGCDVRTHYRRMQLVPEYADSVRRARAFAEVSMIGRIVAGGKGHRGAAWVMERSRPQRWAHKQYIGFDRKKLADMTDGEIAEFLPHARRALTDGARDTDSGTVINITPDQGNGGSEDT